MKSNSFQASASGDHGEKARGLHVGAFAERRHAELVPVGGVGGEFAVARATEGLPQAGCKYEDDGRGCGGHRNLRQGKSMLLAKVHDDLG